jgi:beta-lactamase class A
MISISDNTAADTLLHVVGRAHVEAMMTTIGVRAAARNRPFLSTLEAFALKTVPPAAFEAWQHGSEAQRRAQLAALAPDAARIDPGMFSGGPLRIDPLEWYASPADLARTLDWLRRNGDDATLAILAVNPQMSPSERGDLVYVGYKGGQEPGVIDFSWLVRNRTGTWRVVTGSWNNPAAPVDNQRFLELMVRAVQLVRDGS